jgi:hypothetical protein
MDKMSRYHITDNHIIAMKHEDGSISTIIYTSQGTRAYPRELIEVFSSETVILINNFKTMIIKGRMGNIKQHKLSSNRGHRDMLLAFIDNIANRTPVRTEDIRLSLYSMLVTLKIAETVIKSQNI